jgi:hypothetical protein
MERQAIKIPQFLAMTCHFNIHHPQRQPQHSLEPRTSADVSVSRAHTLFSRLWMTVKQHTTRLSLLESTQASEGVTDE